MDDLRYKPSTTVAAIIERDGLFLLVEEETPEGLRLNNPAGHLDPGESLVQACAREALEETAFAFTPRALVGIYLARVQLPDSPSRPGGSGRAPRRSSRRSCSRSRSSCGASRAS